MSEREQRRVEQMKEGFIDGVILAAIMVLIVAGAAVLASLIIGLGVLMGF